MKMRQLSGLALFAAMAALLFIAGCSTSTPPPETSAQKHVLATFDLSKCQQVDVNLYQCPAMDKPLCKPGFARTDIICVHIGENGELIQSGVL